MRGADACISSEAATIPSWRAGRSRDRHGGRARGVQQREGPYLGDDNDARSEYDVFRRFSELTSGKMALLISHRFSTVRMADTILVLADGKIAEEGDHRKLIALGGLYSEMFELQAANYR